MKNQSFFLQGRIQRIQKFLGLTQENKTVPTIKFNQKIAQLATKWPRDIQTKYDKVKKLTNTYNRVLEETISVDKVETLQQEQEELNQIAAQLEQIQELSSAMNFQPLLNSHQKFKDLSLLGTTSKLQYVDANSPLKTVQFSEQELVGLNLKKREEFEQVVTLYNQIVGNLNYRLQQIYNKVAAIESK